MSRWANTKPVAQYLAGDWANELLFACLRTPTLVCLAFFVLGVSCFESTAAAQENVDLGKWLKQTEDALTKVDNYNAIFHRIEIVKGKLIPEEVTVLKFKRPFKVYMRWIRPCKGQETLYIEGANGNKMRAHGEGLVGLVTLNLDPAGTLALENSRHVITEAGLHKLVGRIAANLSRGLRSGELVSRDHGEQVVYGRKTRELEGILPKDPSKDYYCYRCIVNLDLETMMPIKTRIYDWDDRLVECYGYEDLVLNPGLTDKDFDHKNPEYHFSL